MLCLMQNKYVCFFVCMPPAYGPDGIAHIKVLYTESLYYPLEDTSVF